MSALSSPIPAVTPPQPLDFPAIPGNPEVLDEQCRCLQAAAEEFERNTASIARGDESLRASWQGEGYNAYQKLARAFINVFKQRSGRCRELSWSLQPFAQDLREAQGIVARVRDTMLTLDNRDELQAALNNAESLYEQALQQAVRRVRAIVWRQQGFTIAPGNSLSALGVIELEGALRARGTGALAVEKEARALKAGRGPSGRSGTSPAPAIRTANPAAKPNGGSLFSQPGMFVTWGLANGQFSPQQLAANLAAHGFTWVALEVTNDNQAYAQALSAACAQYGIKFGIWEVGDSAQQAISDVQTYGANFLIVQVEGPDQDIAGLPAAFRQVYPDMPAAVVTNFGGLDTPALAQPWIDAGFSCLPEAYGQDDSMATPANQVARAQQLGWTTADPVIGAYDGFDLSSEYQQAQALPAGDGYSVYSAEYMDNDWGIFTPPSAGN